MEAAQVYVPNAANSVVRSMSLLQALGALSCCDAFVIDLRRV